ncbi:ABC transporter ATP-binding protein, partial [Cutibacterium acnes]
VYKNMAFGLKVAGNSKSDIDARIRHAASILKIDHLLQRLPLELSGGQQQRCALARALIKRAPLVLLDEPLVNLDYKLREELRSELISLFATGDTTVVYATTEPQEALLLGGHTAVMHEGRLLQFAPTLELFNSPASTRVAAIFNDPPMNLLDATAISTAHGVAAIRMND